MLNQDQPRKESKEESARSEELLGLLAALASELHPGRQRQRPPNLETSLERELGLDSLARLELALRLERQFGVRLSEDALMEAETPADLLAAINSAGPQRSERRLERAAAPEATSAPAPLAAKTLVDTLEFHVERHGDRPHIHLFGAADEAEPITYRELWQSAQSIGSGLRNHGIENGATIAIMLPTGASFFSVFFGCLFAGAVPVPIYPPMRRAQIEEHLRRQAGILRNAEAGMLVTTTEAMLFGRLIRGQVETLKHVVTPERLTIGAGVSRPSLADDSLALLQYTSGSTGDPKGVMLTHGNLLANIRAFGDVLSASATDVTVTWLPLYHDMGLIGNWLGSLYHACPVVVMSPLAFLARPERWLWAIHHFGGTLSAAPNFAYELCVHKIDVGDLEGLDLSSWRMAGNGAERVSDRTINAFATRFAPYGFRPEAMTPMYGLAESSVALTMTPVGRGPLIDRVKRDPMRRDGRALPAPIDDSNAMAFVSCGLPLGGHETRVVDPTEREVGDRQEGRIQFRGPSATEGYHRNPMATAALKTGDWLESGDVGYIVAGELYVTGRSKDIIIRAGRNLYPDELENAIGDLEGVRKGRVAVFASPDPRAGTERLIVLAETRLEDADQKGHLRQRIDTLISGLSDLPPDDVVLARPGAVLKTANGKVRRAACRELYESGDVERPAPALARQAFGLMQASLLPELRRLRHALKEGLYAAYASFTIVIFAPAVWCLVLLLPGVSRRRRFLRAAARLLLRLTGLIPVVRGLEKLEDGGSMFVVNHQSYLDSLILSAVLPPRYAFVAKRELCSNVFASLFLQALGTAFVERFDPKGSITDAQQLAERLRAGEPMIAFPEGTFERQPGLRGFYLGAFMAAAEADVPVIPIGIKGTRSALRADGWFIRRGPIEVTIASAIEPAGRDWKALLQLRDHARHAVLKACGEPDLGSEPTWLEKTDASARH